MTQTHVQTLSRDEEYSKGKFSVSKKETSNEKFNICDYSIFLVVAVHLETYFVGRDLFEVDDVPIQSFQRFQNNIKVENISENFSLC